MPCNIIFLAAVCVIVFLSFTSHVFYEKPPRKNKTVIILYFFVFAACLFSFFLLIKHIGISPSGVMGYVLPPLIILPLWVFFFMSVDIGFLKAAVGRFAKQEKQKFAAQTRMRIAMGVMFLIGIGMMIWTLIKQKR